MIRRSLWTIIVFGVSLLAFMGLFQLLLPQSDARLKKQDFVTRQIQGLNYVALGDSLTEGVGDSSQQGGFVPLLAKDIQETYGYQVSHQNFGVAGNTSRQILKRVTKDDQLAQSLKEADLLTLTVGGNDILAVIRKNLTNLNLETFEKEQVKYQKRLLTLIEAIRKDNPDLTIYILGVYNPFYLNFPELTEMQTVIDNWNQATLDFTQTQEGVYFVPINDLLYKGIDGQGGISEASRASGVVNDALFVQDHFHPNSIGYRLMANAVMEVINETTKQWQD